MSCEWACGGEVAMPSPLDTQGVDRMVQSDCVHCSVPVQTDGGEGHGHTASTDIPLGWEGLPHDL